jgi:hypothetical protein
LESDVLGRGDELEATWLEAVALLGFDPGDEWNYFYLRYNGPDDEWLWTASFERRNSDPPFGPTGWGQTPTAAVRAIIKAVEHGVGYWPITRPWDKQSRALAREEGLA